MQILNMVFYTAVMLGALIFIHELGHFLAAKLTGMRVDRFSIGFPPRAFGKKIGDTDYCISWIPLGGYVKIAGMVDESMDTEFLERAPEPWEFRAKPLWKRVTVISAGVIMNVLLAFVIFWGLHYSRGSYIAETTQIGWVQEGSAFAKAGLEAGDRIVEVNGARPSHWEELQRLLFLQNLGNDIRLTVEREGGNRRELFIPAAGVGAPAADGLPPIMVAHLVATVENVEPGMPAERLGLKAGDTLLSVNGTGVNQMLAIAVINRNAGKEVEVRWKRGQEVLSGATTVTKEGRIGVRLGGRYIGPERNIRYTILEAVPRAVGSLGESVYLFYLTVSKLVSGKTSFRDSFGGPIAIAQIATQSAESGLGVFLRFMAELSVSLALLNILPFPALDGGHLAMLGLERLFRREIPHKVKLAIQQAGIILLLAFMAFILYNDITRF